MELDLSTVPDGAYTLDVEVLDGANAIGTASLRIAVQKGLDGTLARAGKLAARAPESAAAPISAIPRTSSGAVNRGRDGVRRSSTSARELTAAETIAAAAKGGKDPFAGRTGDFERHYVLEAAGEIMPYRVFVPKTYNASKPVPLSSRYTGWAATKTA